MKYQIGLLMSIVAVLVISGCTTDQGTTGEIIEKTTQEPVCNPPYIIKGYDCCLDQNNNNICDTDEQPSGQQPPSQQSECISDWKCSGWSKCSSFGTQTRTCTDKNNCGITTGKPSESQPCTPPVIELEPIILSGTGQEATPKFSLEKGLSLFKMTHNGKGHFGIWLLDNMGDRVELIVNEIGFFDGSKAVEIETKNDHLLDISADGDWSVTILQPRSTSAPKIPLTLTGNGQEASDIFYLNAGLVRFEMKHDGSGHFGIWLMDKNGDKEELLVNEIGSFDGSKAVGIINPGIYLLDISADGNWGVSIE